MLSERENNVLMETRLRNLKRRYSKVKEHAELTDEARKILTEINHIETKLN